MGTPQASFLPQHVQALQPTPSPSWLLTPPPQLTWVLASRKTMSIFCCGVDQEDFV